MTFDLISVDTPIKSTSLASFSRKTLNFLLTNRIPRRLATRFMGWFSRIEHPLVRSVDRRSGGCSPTSTSLSARTALPQPARLLHARADAGRPPDRPRPDLLPQPCDAIVGACGPVAGTEVFQAKGFPYTLDDLLAIRHSTPPFRDGRFVTLRLTSSDVPPLPRAARLPCRQVSYIAGDTWNVNPIALKRVEKLFCKNERAVLAPGCARGDRITLVPVAAILVASIRLRFPDVLLHLHRGPNEIPVEARFGKGEEMGGFQHGSTIILFVPAGLRPGGERPARHCHSRRRASDAVARDDRTITIREGIMVAPGKARTAAFVAVITALGLATASPIAALADSDTPWTVHGKLLGKPKDLAGADSKKSEDVSGIACATTTGFPRICLVADDETQGAQIVVLKDGELIAGDFIRLIDNAHNGKAVELDAEGVACTRTAPFMWSAHMADRAMKRMPWRRQRTRPRPQQAGTCSASALPRTQSMRRPASSRPSPTSGNQQSCLG